MTSDFRERERVNIYYWVLSIDYWVLTIEYWLLRNDCKINTNEYSWKNHVFIENVYKNKIIYLKITYLN